LTAWWEKRKTDNAQRDWLAGLHPIGRIGTTEEAAQAVIALLENPFITEVSDGGWGLDGTITNGRKQTCDELMNSPENDRC